MLRLRATLAALLLGAPLTASAAEITRIASSFEDDDPFDLNIDVGFSRTQHRSKILREQLPVTEGGERLDAAELWYKGVDARLNLQLSMGLWRDVEFRFGLPLVFQQNETWNFVSRAEENSTITNNCLRADGTEIPGCLEGTAAPAPLFPIPSETFRGGLGNMNFSLAYAFFNQQKDATKPTWILGITYEAPTAQLLDPSQDVSTSENRGNIGDRVHKYDIYTTLSRRIGVAEPYFRAHLQLPVQGPGIYTNCFNADAGNIGTPSNCFQGPWSRKETGIQAPTRAGFLFGSEFQVYNEPAKQQGLALDLHLVGEYVGEGRYYNELSGVLRRLNYTEDYLQLGGRLGVNANASDTFKLFAAATFLYNTDHAITAEPLGKDLDGQNGVEPATNPAEINPNFDFRTDMVSRQFRVSESTLFRIELGASFTF